MRQSMMLVLLGALTFSTPLLTGCSSGTYDTRYRFSPRPAETRIEATAGDVTLLAAVVGIRNESEHHPPAVEVRMRVENNAGRTVYLDPADLALNTADLKTFPVPEVDPAGRHEILPGQSSELAAWFPFAGDTPYDVGTLSLRWAVDVDGERYVERQTFERSRRVYRYADPYWDPWYGIGYGHRHHHHGFGVHFGYRSRYCW